MSTAGMVSGMHATGTQSGLLWGTQEPAWRYEGTAAKREGRGDTHVGGGSQCVPGRARIGAFESHWRSVKERYFGSRGRCPVCRSVLTANL